MSSVYEILCELADTSSSKKKQMILEGLDEQEKESFIKVAKAALDPQINYWVKDVGGKYDGDAVVQSTLDYALDELNMVVAQRELTGNAARAWILGMYNELSSEDAEVFSRVIERDLKCGVSVKTINKVFPNTIYEHPYMRCSSFSEKSLAKISFPCYSQVKMDGLYIDVVVNTDNVVYMTRSGQVKPEYNNTQTDSALIHHAENYVLMGELLAVDEHGDLMSRQDSNGYLNGDDIDSSRIRLYLWDMVPQWDFFKERECTSLYANRLNLLSNTVLKIQSDSVKMVETVVCENKDDILNHFRICREAGEEGTVIKDKSGHWKNGTSQQQIKCKVIFDCDLKVVGYKMGQGRLEGKLGSLICETTDGKLQVSVGGGYSLKQRDSFLDVVDEMIANETIVTVRGNDVVKNRDDESLYAIFLPRFVEIRTDKTEADTLEQVQEQVKSFTDALDMIK